MIEAQALIGRIPISRPSKPRKAHGPESITLNSGRVSVIRVTSVHVLRRSRRGRDRHVGRKRVWSRVILSINVCLGRERWCSVVRDALGRDSAEGWTNIGVDQVHPVEQLSRGKVKVPASSVHSGTEYTICAR